MTSYKDDDISSNVSHNNNLGGSYETSSGIKNKIPVSRVTKMQQSSMGKEQGGLVQCTQCGKSIPSQQNAFSSTLVSKKSPDNASENSSERQLEQEESIKEINSNTNQAINTSKNNSS